MAGAYPEGVHWVPVNPLHIKQEKFLLGIKSKNASSLLLCLHIFAYHVMILYVPLMPTCEPLLNFFWIRPCMGECSKLPQQVLGQSPSRSRTLLHCMLAKRIWLQHFWFFGQQHNERQNESKSRLRSNLKFPCTKPQHKVWVVYQLAGM